jgi:glycosyltransferase involved in cell wall biosynthesis
MVVHGPYPLGEPRVEREALAARDAGWEVEVIATATVGAPAEENCDGIRVRRLPVTHVRGGSLAEVVREYSSFTILAALAVLRRSRRRFDVVQVHNPPDFLFLAALVPKLLGSATIIDIHDFSPELFTMRLGRRRFAARMERLLRAVEWGAAQLADAVVTVHEPYRRALVDRGVAAPKLLTVMNTLDERHLPHTRPRAPVPRVVSHGTVTEHYGLDLLVDAVALAGRSMRVELYGDGDALPRVRERITALGLDDSFVIEGRYLPLPEVLARVAGADVGVVCNRPIERNLLAVPTKLFEYVALGIPVVAADLPAVREHFDDDEVAFFEAGDAAALAGALKQTLADPEAAQARAWRATRRYGDYRWPVSAARYTDLLDRLAGAA